MPLEREIKLRFESASAARERILAIGATPLRARRLQDDTLVDTADRRLAERGVALRVRADGDTAVLTFKGPVQPGAMKMRDEYETGVGDRPVLLTILHALGFDPAFSYQKYREEFSVPGAIVAIDETPIGVFVEIEGAEDRIHATAAALGKTPAEYITASYRALYDEHCRRQGLTPGMMRFA